MNISLYPHFEALVKGKVESGLYKLSERGHAGGFATSGKRDQLRELRLEELRREIQKGIDSGASTSLDMAEIKARGL